MRSCAGSRERPFTADRPRFGGGGGWGRPARLTHQGYALGAADRKNRVAPGQRTPYGARMDTQAATEPLADADYARMVRAIRWLDAHAEAAPDLAAVAAAMGLSPHHAQRVFTRWAGVSPKRFLQAASATRARTALENERSVLDASLDAGVSSTGRLHDLLVTVEAMSPGEMRKRGAGLEIRWGRHTTPFGLAEIGVTTRGVCSLVFLDQERANPLGQDDWPRATWVRNDAATAAVAAAITAPDSTTPLSLLVRGTNLQVQVWRALLRVPAGHVVSYGALAAHLKRPTAARAVASAVAANRIGYLIPCHRVLRATGAISGYRWGPERKRIMLAWERAPLHE